MQPPSRILPRSALILSLALAAGCAGQAPPPAVESATVASPESVRARPAARDARNSVMKTVRAMVGVPYRYGGSSPRGFDCSGLVWYAYRQAGIRVPRTAAQQFRVAARKRPERLLPGDLVFFADRKGRIFHVGTYVGRGRFIHAPSSGGEVTMSKLSEPYWRTRLVGVGSFY